MLGVDQCTQPKQRTWLWPVCTRTCWSYRKRTKCCRFGRVLLPESTKLQAALAQSFGQRSRPAPQCSPRLTRDSRYVQHLPPQARMMMAVKHSHFFFHTNLDSMCRLVILQHIQKRLILQLTFHTELF